MASEVSICNIALGWLGQTPISSLSEASVTGELCKANYDEARQAVLTEGVWSFAQRKFVLEIPTTPTTSMWGVNANYFRIPADILNIREAYSSASMPGDPLKGWTVEGPHLVSSWGKVFCIGTSNVIDPNAMDAPFRACLAARLAADLCIPITQSQTMAADAWAMYEDKLTRAAVMDASQSRRYAVGGGRITKSRWDNLATGRGV